MIYLNSKKLLSSTLLERIQLTQNIQDRKDFQKSRKTFIKKEKRKINLRQV